MSAKNHRQCPNNTTAHQNRIALMLSHQLPDNEQSRKSELSLSMKKGLLVLFCFVLFSLGHSLRRTWPKKSAYLETYRRLPRYSENTSSEFSRSSDSQLKWNRRLFVSMSALKIREMTERLGLPTNIFTGQRIWREVALVFERTSLLIVES